MMTVLPRDRIAFKDKELIEVEYEDWFFKDLSVLSLLINKWRFLPDDDGNSKTNFPYSIEQSIFIKS